MRGKRRREEKNLSESQWLKDFNFIGSTKCYALIKPLLYSLKQGE
jgi:hypothetical protein